MTENTQNNPELLKVKEQISQMRQDLKTLKAKKKELLEQQKQKGEKNGKE